MKAKSHYLLDFCVLLTLFYLCNSCVDLTAYYDSGDNKFKLCARKPNGESYENYGFVLGSQLDCESAKAHVKSVGNLFKIVNNGFCEKINSNCYYINSGCKLIKCEELENKSFQYCGSYEGLCKINDFKGFNTEANCTIKTFDQNNELFCNWENENCTKMLEAEGLNEMILLGPSGDNYIYFSDGERCVELNSCENVKLNNTISKEELSSICSKFSHCSPGNNNDCINNCNNIASEDECNYSFMDNETLIKCKWNKNGPDGKKCQVDGDIEIKSCVDASNLTDIRDEQCSKLKVTKGKY